MVGWVGCRRGLGRVGTKRSWLALTLVFAAGCTRCSTPAEVAWPASRSVDLEAELAATAASEGIEPLLLNITPQEQPPIAMDEPFVHARSFVHAGLWYAEVVLGDVDPDAPLPLVVMLHGLGDRPRIPGGPFGGAPTPFRALIPRGPLRVGKGFAWVPYRVRDERPKELAAALDAVSEQLASLIAHVRRTRPTLGTTIVTGFSQGGLLAWATALRHAGEVGLAMPLAGWIPPALMPTGRIVGPSYPPMKAMHGTDDAIVPVAPTRRVVAALEQVGYDVTLVEFDGVAHVITPEMNALYERWLEEALVARAPGMLGGPGLAGPETDAYEPYEDIPDLPPDSVIDEAPVPVDDRFQAYGPPWNPP